MVLKMVLRKGVKMITIFRVFLYISLALLIFFGWFIIFLGFHIISISTISPFINYKIAIFGFFMWLVVLLIFSLEKRLFYSSDGIDINGEHGSIRITKSAIEDAIRQIEIDGIDEIRGEVSIRDGGVELKIIVSSFLSSISQIKGAINKEIDGVMKALSLTNYRKKIYIAHIKKKGD